MRPVHVFIGLIFSLVAGLLAAAWTLGGMLLVPKITRAGNPPMTLRADTVAIPAGDVTLGGWFVRSTGGRGTVILAPHFDQTRRQMLARANLLKGEGFNVLLIDPRGTGESRAHLRSLGGSYERDLAASIRWVRSQTANREVAIIGIGFGAVAAARVARTEDVSAIVLEGAASAPSSLLIERLRPKLGALAPAIGRFLIFGVRLRAGGLEVEPLVDVIALSRAPVLIMGAELDPFIDADDRLALYTAARPPRTLSVFQDIEDTDLMAGRPSDYRQHVLGFLDRTMPLPPVH